jgi:hypothetical protein
MRIRMRLEFDRASSRCSALAVRVHSGSRRFASIFKGRTGGLRRSRKRDGRIAVQPRDGRLAVEPQTPGRTQSALLIRCRALS